MPGVHPQSRQWLLWWPRDSAVPGPLSSGPCPAGVSALPSSQASWPFVLPLHVPASAQEVYPGSLPHVPHAPLRALFTSGSAVCSLSGFSVNTQADPAFSAGSSR